MLPPLESPSSSSCGVGKTSLKMTCALVVGACEGAPVPTLRDESSCWAWAVTTTTRAPATAVDSVSHNDENSFLEDLILNYEQREEILWMAGYAWFFSLKSLSADANVQGYYTCFIPVSKIKHLG
jgi:hypothetical protein